MLLFVPRINASLHRLQGTEQEQTPSQLLEPLKSSCLFRQEDWWTYEICPGQHVRQFHQHNQELMSQYDLGKYDSNATDVRPSLCLVCCGVAQLCCGESDTVVEAERQLELFFAA